MDNLTFAGDVIIDSVQIKSMASNKTIDIKNQVIGVNIYEDIYSPFITGSLSIKDSVDLVNALPFVGEEVLILKLRTPGLEIKTELECYIYKCSDRTYTGDRAVVYSLYFTSSEAIVNANTKMSRAFRGNFDSIATDIVKVSGIKTKKNFNFTKSTGSTKFVSNYWSPVATMDYLCSIAESASKTPSYIFFENREGFNFVTFDSLYAENAIQDFNYSNFVREVTSNSSYRDIDKDYKRIINLTVPKAFDYLSDITLGKYSAKHIIYDSTTKQYRLESYDYLKDFGRSKHLNSYPVATAELIRRFNSSIVIRTNHTELHTGYGTTTQGDVSPLLRQSMLLQAESTVINITVPGRFDYTVGKKVNLKLYKTQPITSAETDNDILDKIYSGTYLISAVNHSVLKNSHTCDMELIKDSYMFDISKGN